MSGSRTTSCPKNDLENTDLQEPGEDFSCIGSVQIEATLWAAGLLSLAVHHKKLFFRTPISKNLGSMCPIFNQDLEQWSGWFSEGSLV